MPRWELMLAGALGGALAFIAWLLAIEHQLKRGRIDGLG